MWAQSVFETVSLAEVPGRGLPIETGSHRPVVLVVDDEAIIADTRTAIFRNWGYAAMAAYSGEAAMEIAQVIPPQLLVSDVLLTGMNGVELAIAVQKMVPDCHVLLFSGLPSSVDMLAVAASAGHNFTLLDKPLHPAQLFSFLATLDLAPPKASGFKPPERN
jgi:DNA-binding NtrC family response regulator